MHYYWTTGLLDLAKSKLNLPIHLSSYKYNDECLRIMVLFPTFGIKVNKTS